LAIRIAEREMVLNAEGCWQRQGKTGVKLLTGIRFVEPKPEHVRALWDFVGAQAATLAGFLRDGAAFRDIDLDDAMDLALCTRILEVPAGHRIYGPGICEDGADAAFVVYVGEVLLEARNDRGRAVLIERVGVGRVFGGLTVVVGVPHIESATAATAARLIEIDREAFAYLERAKPRAARLVTVAVVRRQTSNLSQLVERATAL
jgi:CRP-like cAMP-binding protein